MNKRGGVLIGDVVGLGKTLMASALAKIFQDDHYTETLILCPKNLVKMWQDYIDRYRLIAEGRYRRLDTLPEPDAKADVLQVRFPLENTITKESLTRLVAELETAAKT